MNADEDIIVWIGLSFFGKVFVNIWIIVWITSFSYTCVGILPTIAISVTF